MTKQERYDELQVKFDADNITDAEQGEHVQLWYELNPDDPYVRSNLAGRTPCDVWGFDTSVYE
jgi:hypothetical protein